MGIRSVIVLFLGFNFGFVWIVRVLGVLSFFICRLG